MKANLVWAVLLVLVLTLGGAFIGLYGWCGDDLPACSSDVQLRSLPAIAVVIVMAAGIVFAVLIGTPWTASRSRRRRVAIVVSGMYLVLVAIYLFVTAVLPRS